MLGCITFQVSGLWVWPRRSIKGRSEGCGGSLGWAAGRHPWYSASLTDCTLYTGLDEVAEEQTQLFRCPEKDVPVLFPQ